MRATMAKEGDSRMEHTPQQTEEFKREYSTRRRRQLVVSAPFIVAIVLLAVAQDREAGTVAGIPQGIWLPVFVVGVIGLLIFSLFNWRCPACSAYFGRTWNPRFCSKCGTPLRD